MRRITIMSSLLALLTSIAFSAPALSQDNRILVAEDAPKRVLIPSAQNGGDKLSTAWHAVDFDDSAWRAGRGGVGLEARGEDYKPFISIDVQEQMYNKQTSAFIRIPFAVKGEIPSLLLRVRYDDGFVAYLNGVEVARANFTGEPSWNSSSENRMVNETDLPFENFNITASLGTLKQGRNLLAIHGMQDRPNSSDFLICVELMAGVEASVARAASEVQAAQSAAAAQVAQPPQSQVALLVEVPKSEEPVSEDWPCWRGPHGNGKSGVKGIKKDWSGGLEKLWEKGDLCQGEGNTSTWSAPSILGDKMVIPGRHGDKDVIFCFNAETGEPLWKREYATVPDNRQGGGDRYGSGSFASPNIDGDRAYTFGGWGDLACWKLENGEQIWKKNVRDLGGISANFGFTSSPLVYQDKVIVHGGGDVMIVAFDKMTGQIVWKCSWDDGGSGRPGYGSPMVANLGGRDQILTSVTAAGRRRGRHYAGRVAGLDPEHGVVLWEVPWWCFYELFAVPVVEDPIAVVTTGMRSGSMALQIDSSGATQIWENWGNNILSPSHSLPVILDGYVYGYSGHSSDYYEEDRPGRELQCVDLRTGRLQWRGGPDDGWGTLIYVDGHLLCLTGAGKLLLVDPNPTEYRKVTEFQTGLRIVDSGYPKKSQFAWTHPVVAHGKVYVRYCNQLICYNLKN